MKSAALINDISLSIIENGGVDEFNDFLLQLSQLPHKTKPLMWRKIFDLAVKENDIEKAKILISKADKEIKDCNNKSKNFYFAIKNNNPEMVKLLIETYKLRKAFKEDDQDKYNHVINNIGKIDYLLEDWGADKIQLTRKKKINLDYKLKLIDGVKLKFHPLIWSVSLLNINNDDTSICKILLPYCYPKAKNSLLLHNAIMKNKRKHIDLLIDVCDVDIVREKINEDMIINGERIKHEGFIYFESKIKALEDRTYIKEGLEKVTETKDKSKPRVF